MSKNWKMLLTSLVAISALSGSAALYAQGDEPQSGAGMMAGGSGGMMGQMSPGDMMGMMGQMSQMMDTCNKMMRAMMPQGADEPKPKPSPEEAK